MVCLKIAAVLVILSKFVEIWSPDVSNVYWRFEMERFVELVQHLSVVYVCLAVIYF